MSADQAHVGQRWYSNQTRDAGSLPVARPDWFPERWWVVLEARSRGETQHAIGVRLGISREGVKRMEMTALRALARGYVRRPDLVRKE